MAKVTTIPATISRFTATPINEKKKRRTAAYARVSTDSEEQLTSYSAQVDYYTNYIKSRDDWEFVSVYTDEGITGTNTKHREGFKRMVADALAGKIDLIVTKSVSRFARNTVDSLTTVRQLKEKGVEIYFEKENINTGSMESELFLAILSSMAEKIIVLCTDEPTSLTDAYAFIKIMAMQYPKSDLNVVINQANSIREGQRTYDTLLKACTNFLKINPPLLGIIRRDTRVRDAIRNQTPLINRFPTSEAAEDVIAIARKLITE